jgi:hypothetical protein
MSTRLEQPTCLEHSAESMDPVRPKPADWSVLDCRHPSAGSHRWALLGLLHAHAFLPTCRNDTALAVISADELSAHRLCQGHGILMSTRPNRPDYIPGLAGQFRTIGVGSCIYGLAPQAFVVQTSGVVRAHPRIFARSPFGIPGQSFSVRHATLLLTLCTADFPTPQPCGSVFQCVGSGFVPPACDTEPPVPPTSRRRLFTCSQLSGIGAFRTTPESGHDKPTLADSDGNTFGHIAAARGRT